MRRYTTKWWQAVQLKSIEHPDAEEMPSGPQSLLPFSHSNKESEEPDESAVKRFSKAIKQAEEKPVLKFVSKHYTPK